MNTFAALSFSLTLLVVTPVILAKTEVDDPLSVEPKQPVAQPTSDHSSDNKAAKLLAKILAGTSTYKADFKQSVYRENNSQAEITLGVFMIQRPNRFRWETKQPFEQLIIADGSILWTYDPELEQASIQNQHAVLADSPLLLLTSHVKALIEAFDIAEVQSRNDETPNVEQHLFSLTPKTNSLFESVLILIEDQKMKEFFLTDTLGGRTSVEFNHIELNQTINLSNFVFVPPKDIDVIDSRETINE